MFRATSIFWFSRFRVKFRWLWKGILRHRPVSVREGCVAEDSAAHWSSGQNPGRVSIEPCQAQRGKSAQPKDHQPQPLPPSSSPTVLLITILSGVVLVDRPSDRPSLPIFLVSPYIKTQ